MLTSCLTLHPSTPAEWSESHGIRADGRAYVRRHCLLCSRMRYGLKVRRTRSAFHHFPACGRLHPKKPSELVHGAGRVSCVVCKSVVSSKASKDYGVRPFNWPAPEFQVRKWVRAQSHFRCSGGA